MKIVALRHLRFIALLLAIDGATELATPAHAQIIVWTDINSRRIQRKEAGGGSVSTVVQFPPGQSAQGIHYEPLLRKLYYVSFSDSGSVFWRINLDGSGTEVIGTPSASPTFQFNVESRKLHWITPDSFTTINRSELDGTETESHTYPSCCIFSVYPLGEDLYFGAGMSMTKGIWRANADGSGEHFLRSTGPAFDLAYDPVDKKLYIATTEQIDRMNLDGTGFEVIVHLPAWQQLLSGPSDIEVDYLGRKLYWTDHMARIIQRANLDGSNVEDFLTATDVGNPSLDLRGLTIVQSPSIPAVSNSGMVGSFVIILLAGSYFAVRRDRVRNHKAS